MLPNQHYHIAIFFVSSEGRRFKGMCRNNGKSPCTHIYFFCVHPESDGEENMASTTRSESNLIMGPIKR